MSALTSKEAAFLSKGPVPQFAFSNGLSQTPTLVTGVAGTRIVVMGFVASQGELETATLSGRFRSNTTTATGFFGPAFAGGTSSLFSPMWIMATEPGESLTWSWNSTPTQTDTGVHVVYVVIPADA